MIYLTVIIISAAGIAAIIMMRGMLRSRNARRIVRSIKRGLTNVSDRNAKLLPDMPARKEEKSPRAAAIELQQVRSLLATAEKACAKQDARGAERALIQALTMQPDAAEVKAKLARLYLDTSREPKAAALYKEILKTMLDDTSKGKAAILANLGLACYRQNKFWSASRAYREALKLDPKNAGRKQDLGRALYAENKFEEAAPLLEDASQELRKDTRLLHLLAKCYEQLKDEEGADDAYRRINKLDPRDEEAKARIGAMAAGAV